MKRVIYNFYDRYRILLEGCDRTGLSDFNLKYGWFADPGFNGETDMHVRIGPFRPDLRGTVSIDHRYYVRKDYVYFREQDRGLSWEGEVEGLESARTRVRVRYALRNRLRFPWMLFPDMVFNMHILHPLLEMKLAERSLNLLHAGATEQGGCAFLFAGRGSAYKTTLTSRMLKQGHALLGDDFVLLDGGHIRPFPTHLGLFAFQHDRLSSEDGLATLKGRALLLLSLLRNRGTSFPIGRPAAPRCLFLLKPRRGLAAPEISECGTADALRLLLLNNRMERTAYAPFRSTFGRFLDAYRLVHPGPGGAEEATARALNAMLADCRCRICLMPERWSERNLSVVDAAATCGRSPSCG